MRFANRCSLSLLAVIAGLDLLSGCAAAVPSPSLRGSTAAEVPANAGWVVDFVDGTSLDDAREQLGDASAEWFHPLAADDGIIVVSRLSEGTRQALAAHPSVEGVEPSVPMTAYGFPDDPLYGRQWNMDRIGAPAGWRLGSGNGVIVAVIDTGVSPVPDLSGTTLLAGASFVDGEPDATDGNGHGTHVAGTIAQTTNNGLGVAGIAPQATVLPLKALSATGSGRSEWVAAAIDEAGDQGAHIINLSLGGPESGVITRAVEKAQARGILVIAAAGNTGRAGVGHPARVAGVIAVSATGPADTRAPYSTFGPEVVLSAPGGDKRQLDGGILQDTVSPGSAEGHDFLAFQGTSMATPHVAGAAAVLWGATGGGADYVANVLVDSAVDLGEPGRDAEYGHGRLDLAAAAHRVVWYERGVLAGLAALVALGLAVLTGAQKGRFTTMAVAAWTAGGLFFLPLLPFAPSMWVDLLSRPLLLWAGPLLGVAWARSPWILSAVLPAAATFTLGPSRTFGYAVAGLSAGIGTHLLFGAATGALQPTFFGAGIGTAWLVLHGGFSLMSAVASLGVQKLHEDEARRQG